MILRKNAPIKAISFFRQEDKPLLKSLKKPRILFWGTLSAIGLSIVFWSPLQSFAEPVPYTSLYPGTDTPQNNQAPQVPPTKASEDFKILKPVQIPSLLTQADAVREAKRGNVAWVQARQADSKDPAIGKTLTWLLIQSFTGQTSGNPLDFATLKKACQDLANWPYLNRCYAAAERAIESANLDPKSVLDWFGNRDPETAEGAISLASSLISEGRKEDAKILIRHYWDWHIFDAEVQGRMLARFGDFLTPSDHAIRLSTLGYRGQTPALRAMMTQVDEDHRNLAQLRLALRANQGNITSLLEKLTPDLRTDPGLSIDLARFYRHHQNGFLSPELIRNFPSNIPDKSDIAHEIWIERRASMTALLQAGNYEAAYAAVTNIGLHGRADLAEAEFYAGWIAWHYLKNPALSESHFAHMQANAQSAITLARSYYWHALTLKALGRLEEAKALLVKGSAYYTTFYGMLSAQASGQTSLTIGQDPVITSDDRQQFEIRDLIRGAKWLYQAKDYEDFRLLMIAAAEESTKAQDLACLMDMALEKGDHNLNLKIARIANYHGYFLPERAYPLLEVPSVEDGASKAFVLGIIRQESSFDPYARSPAGARGLMQLMPTTARGLAHTLKIRLSRDQWEEPSMNMTLGSYFLGQLTRRFGGSELLAAAAYNAGPGRVLEWTKICGDPRNPDLSRTDAVNDKDVIPKNLDTKPATTMTLDFPALDFMECIPFAETRDYVMRVLENQMFYQARLNGGKTPLRPIEELGRSNGTRLPTVDQILDDLSS